MWQADSKIYIESKRLKVAKVFLKKEMGRNALSVITNYYKAIAIKMMWYLHEDKQKSN